MASEDNADRFDDIELLELENGFEFNSLPDFLDWSLEQLDGEGQEAPSANPSDEIGSIGVPQIGDNQEKMESAGEQRLEGEKTYEDLQTLNSNGDNILETPVADFAVLNVQKELSGEVLEQSVENSPLAQILPLISVPEMVTKAPTSVSEGIKFSEKVEGEKIHHNFRPPNSNGDTIPETSVTDSAKLDAQKDLSGGIAKQSVDNSPLAQILPLHTVPDMATTAPKTYHNLQTLNSNEDNIQETSVNDSTKLDMQKNLLGGTAEQTVENSPLAQILPFCTVPQMITRAPTSVSEAIEFLNTKTSPEYIDIGAIVQRTERFLENSKVNKKKFVACVLGCSFNAFGNIMKRKRKYIRIQDQFTHRILLRMHNWYLIPDQFKMVYLDMDMYGEWQTMNKPCKKNQVLSSKEKAIRFHEQRSKEQVAHQVQTAPGFPNRPITNPKSELEKWIDDLMASDDPGEQILVRAHHSNPNFQPNMPQS